MKEKYGQGAPYSYRVVGYKTYDLGDRDIVVCEVFDNPAQAISCWLEHAAECPMEVSIVAHSKREAEALVGYAASHEEWFKEEYAKHKNPYKLEYLLDGVEKGAAGFIEGPFGDEVFPFCEG